MAKQFSYQDRHGKIYPAHPTLAFTEGLVPGNYDTDTRVFTPLGNPKQKVGNVITDAGFGGKERLLSGLYEDKGADTAPLNGVAFAGLQHEKEELQLHNNELQAKQTELEMELEKARTAKLELEAKLFALENQAKTDTPSAKIGETESGTDENNGKKKVVKVPVPAAPVNDSIL